MIWLILIIIKIVSIYEGTNKTQTFLRGCNKCLSYRKLTKKVQLDKTEDSITQSCIRIPYEFTINVKEFTIIYQAKLYRCQMHSTDAKLLWYSFKLIEKRLFLSLTGEYSELIMYRLNMTNITPAPSLIGTKRHQI